MTLTQDGDLLPWERPMPELEEFEGAGSWVGCSTCGAQQKITNGLDKYLWWRAHLYDHIRGARP